MEEPKRLNPTPEVLRELYLKSGNLCAFPGCQNFIMNSDGIFVGQICHIEAALPGGERFNPRQQNEERRGIGNLMLMCYEHHMITNDVQKYTVDRLKEMKERHETKFFDVVDKMEKSIVDQSTVMQTKPATSLNRLNQVLNFGFNQGEEELAFMVKELEQLQNRLRLLPKPTRQLLVIIVRRTPADNRSAAQHYSSRDFIAAEIQMASRLSDNEMRNHLAILNQHGFIRVDESGQQPSFSLRNISKGEWDVWQDFQKYCDNTGITLEELIVDVNFSLLD